MPTLWGVIERPRPHNQDGQGIELSFDELRAIFEGYQPQWEGAEPPDFPESTSESRWPSLVYVEVRASDGVNEAFHSPGFYLIPDLHPREAEAMVADFRRRTDPHGA
jgi:hypothetical protein